MDFEIHLRSLRGHKGVKGQIYKDAPIELKFQYNDPYDILSILKYFLIHSRLLRGHKVVKGQIFKNFTKPIDSNLNFGSFGVTGVKSSFLLKMLLLIQYTLYGHVTYAYIQAWDPLQNSLTQISIWGHMGQKVISTKSDIPVKVMLHSMTTRLMHMY